MATNPQALLLASSIFGPQPSMADPRVRALFGMPSMTPPFVPPVVRQPVPVPVPVPAHPPAADPHNNPFAFWNQPQDPNEPDIAYMFRNAVGAPFRAIDSGVKDAAAGIRSMGDTPAKREQRQKAGSGAFPTSFSDPRYDALEAAYAQGVGNPSLADMLARLRTRGEQSNAGQVSSAGAQTPYQISPATRQNIMKQYGFDPWASPQNAVRGAAIAATAYTGMKANFNDAATMAKAAGGYFAGKAGADNPFGTASDGNNTTGQYVQRVLGPDTPLPAPFLNAYDPRYDKAAMGMIGAERQAMMTPFSAEMDIGPAPKMPEPQAIPQTDFTASDKALEDLRPVEMSEKERIQRERDGFFQGIAKAMMSSNGNEGLGTFLMHLGGGALAGRMAARDDIRAAKDKFDTEMAKYHAAVFNNELNKATVHAREAQAQVEQTNAYNINNWKVAYDQWSKSGSVDISGTNAVLTTRTPEGKLTVRTIPIASAVDAAIAQQSAQLFQHMGGMQFAGNQQITSMTNALIGQQAIKSMQGGSTSEADAAAAAAPAFYGTFIASHGLIGDMLGQDGAKSLEDSVTKQLQQMQLMSGSKEWIDRHDRLVATELTKLGLASPAMMQRMMQVGGSATAFAQMSRYYGRSERETVDAKGRTSTSTTYDGNAADIFGQ